MERFGIFGGSFDPVHIGHLLVAQAAKEELQLARLFFIPAAQSPFKPANKPSSGEMRMRLLRLALAGFDWAEVDDRELKRGGLSYTAETLREYVSIYSQARLFYLIGADHVNQLPYWREPGELARMAEFVVISRPGEVQASLPPPFRGSWLTGFPLGVSSSQIRARVKLGLPITHLVPSPVAEAVSKSGLYL